MYFHGARFSNYEAWLSDPTHIKPSAQVVWPVVGQEILNGDVGGGFQGIQITSGFFQLWRASGITSELQLYTTAIGGLVMAVAMFFAGWFHYHKAAPKLEWFQNVESMLNHHLAGLLGLGSLGWAGHQIHISLPINKLLDAGVDPKEIPLPHDLMLNRAFMADLYPSFSKGLAPFFTLQWSEYGDFLTFKGGLNPVTGGLWLSDTAHHHLAIAVLFLVAGHMYRTNWGIGHSIKEILSAHKGPFTGEGHVGLYEILTTSWHAQLAINLAMLGSLSIIVAHHMYAMPPYPYLATDYGTQLSLFTHHMWIGGFCVVGAGAHAAIFMVRDYDPTSNYNNLLDRVIRHRDAMISHLNWVCIFLGFHSFGLYIHNDTMSALGRPQDMFSDTAIQLQPVFAQWIQNTHFLAPQLTAPNALAATSATWGGDIIAVGGKVAMMPISLGTADFMVFWEDGPYKTSLYAGITRLKLKSLLESVFCLSKTSQKFFKAFYLLLLVKRTGLGARENLNVRVNQQETPAGEGLISLNLSQFCALLFQEKRKILSVHYWWYIIKYSLTVLASVENMLLFREGVLLSCTNHSRIPQSVASLTHGLGFGESWFRGFGKSPLKSRNQTNRSQLNATKKDGERANDPSISPVGSSETTREACSKLDFSLYYQDGIPLHKKEKQKTSAAFLAWFIGFFEGDGNFHKYRKIVNGIKRDTGRFGFSIDQKNPDVLYRIKKELGFGIIYSYIKKGEPYWRYNTTSHANILRLVSLLNGNLVLEKRRQQFAKWVTGMNTSWGTKIVIKQSECIPTLNDAWLAGFVQADGGFWTNISNGFKKGRLASGEIRYAFVVKFYITQDGEAKVLGIIRDLLEATNKIGTVTNGKTSKKYLRFETTAFKPREIITSYLSKFPLYGTKNIEYKRWLRTNEYFNEKYQLTSKSVEKLLRLLESIEEPSSEKIFSSKWLLKAPVENDDSLIE